MIKRIRNLKYDPSHADKPMRGYSHLEYLDKVFTIERAKKVIAYEKKHRCQTMEIVEVPKKSKKKKEAPDLELTSYKSDNANDSES